MNGVTERLSGGLSATNTTPALVTFTSRKPPPELPDNFLWKDGPSYLLGVVTGVMTLLMIVGNVLVLSALCLRKSVRSPSNLIIGATSLNDLLTALLYLVFVCVSCFTNTWIGGELGLWCQFSATFALISMKVTFMNISMIAVERLLSIRLPLYYRRLCSSKRVLVAIAAAWFLVYLSGILLIYLQNYGEGFFQYSRHYKQCVIYWDQSADDTSASQVYSTFELSFNVTLFAIMLTCNGYVLFVIRYHVANMNRQQETVARNHGNGDGGANKSFTPVYIRALSTTIVVVTVFIVSWIPYYIIFIILNQTQSSHFSEEHNCYLPTLYDISWWLTYIGPVVNPYLFAFRLESFRSVIKGWIVCSETRTMPLSKGEHSLVRSQNNIKRSNLSVNIIAGQTSPMFPRTYSTLNSLHLS